MGTGAGISDEIKRYLETGEYDMLSLAWSGDNHVERMKRGHAELQHALVAEVKRRASTPEVPPALQGLDLVEFGRRKAEPMVRGLFPRAEQDIVLALIERSVAFVTPDSIEAVLLGCEDPGSAWDIANLYLSSVNAEFLGRGAPDIVGFSEETACYVSPAYFEKGDPFADFVVHEVAHIFHNCRRQMVGLPEKPGRKYLLDIDFRKRETFAYACEAYSRILECGRGAKERRQLTLEFDGFDVSDERVDAAEVAAIVRAACEKRNGWKVILHKCSPA